VTFAITQLGVLTQRDYMCSFVPSIVYCCVATKCRDLLVGNASVKINQGCYLFPW